LDDEKLRTKSKKSFEDDIRGFIELTHESWLAIQLMPYEYFVGSYKWKIDLDEKKNKKAEERARLEDERIRRMVRKSQTTKRR